MTVQFFRHHHVGKNQIRPGSVRKRPERTRGAAELGNMTKPSLFRYFRKSSEIIRLAVMPYVLFPP